MAQNQSQDLLSTYLLVVADKPAARDELALALTTLTTAKITTVTSFTTAVNELQIQDQRIDLAVIDLEMAGSAAVTLTRKLRDPIGFRARNIGILLIGGDVKTPLYLAAARLGIQGHLARPFTPERLRQAIRAALLARPTEVSARPAAPAPASKPVAAAPIAAPEPVQPYVPPVNKPFRHGLQSMMKVTQPLSAEEAFGFEYAPSLVRPRVDIQPASYGVYPSLGRKLSAVG